MPPDQGKPKRGLGSGITPYQLNIRAITASRKALPIRLPRESDCSNYQAECGGFLQGCFSLIMALRMVRSFRMHATRVTVLAFPATSRRW